MKGIVTRYPFSSFIFPSPVLLSALKKLKKLNIIGARWEDTPNPTQLNWARSSTCSSIDWRALLLLFQIDGMSSRISLVRGILTGDFPKEVQSWYEKSEEGHQEVLLVGRRRIVDDVVVGLEDVAHSPRVGDSELVSPVHAHRERQLIEPVAS